jgi:hypothetical protein
MRKVIAPALQGLAGPAEKIDKALLQLMEP